MNKCMKVAAFTCVFLLMAILAHASIVGDLLNRGIFLDDGGFELYNGDISAVDLTASDDVTVGDDLVVTGLATIGETLVVTGTILGAISVIDYVTTATARTVTAAESGTVFTSTDRSDDPVTFNLPTAVSGLTYTFVDLDVTAAADLKIQAAAADTINGGTAAKLYECTGDAVKQSVTILAVDATAWVIISELGTWANNNS